MRTCPLVDDSRVIRKVARRWRISASASRRPRTVCRALEMCRTAMPDCILVDAAMPKLDGIGFMKAAPRGDRRAAGDRLCTTENEEMHAASARAAGARRRSQALRQGRRWKAASRQRRLLSSAEAACRSPRPQDWTRARPWPCRNHTGGRTVRMIRFAALLPRSRRVSRPPPGCPRYAAARGSYLESCRELWRRWRQLRGECLERFGRVKKTWIAGYAHCGGDIYNNNGVLDCRPGVPPPAGPPVPAQPATPPPPEPASGAAAAGAAARPWSKTRRDGGGRGDRAAGDLPGSRKVWRRPGSDLATCTGGEIANRDGLLVCVAPPAPALVALGDTLPKGSWLDTCCPARSGTTGCGPSAIPIRQAADQRSRPETLQARHGAQQERRAGLRLRASG